MTAAPQIRWATGADVTALDAIDAVAWDLASTPGPLPLPAPFDARLPLDATLVAVGADVVIGYAVVVSRTSLLDPGGTGLVRSLAVAPAARGRGVATALLIAVDDLCRARGHRQLVLSVLGSNHAARRLYARAGYQEHARFPGEFEIEGRPVDDVIMGKAL
jgi:ribosomal protein S18 acetylase RimI-like enzyme